MNYKPYITAFLLILYMPKMAFIYIRENIRILLIAIGIMCLFMLVSYRLSPQIIVTEETEPTNIIDLTAAFSTGEKRSKQVELIAIHHTAGSPDSGVNEICKVHLKENNWNGLGYHFFIDKNGNIYQLRPLDERVPHAYGCNNNGIAICLAGNFSKTNVPMVQWKSAIELTRLLMKKYHLVKENVYKHSELSKFSELNNTECAGLNFDMTKFRNEL